MQTCQKKLRIFFSEVQMMGKVLQLRSRDLSRESRELWRVCLVLPPAHQPTSDLVSQCSLGLLFEVVFKMSLSLPSLILNNNQKSIFHGIDLILLSKSMWVVKKTKKIFTMLDSFTILLQYF